MALWVMALGEAPPLRAVDLFLHTAIPLPGGEIVACVRLPGAASPRRRSLLRRGGDPSAGR